MQRWGSPWLALSLGVGVLVACSDGSTGDLAPTANRPVPSGADGGGAGGVAGAGGSAATGGAGGEAGTPLDAATTTISLGTPFSDVEAIAWLNAQCAACHGIRTTASGTELAPDYSSWGMPDGFGVPTLETDQMTPVVYETLFHRLVGGVAPSPMPVATPGPGKESDDLKRAIAWFQVALPFSVAEADAQYKNDNALLGALPQVVETFKCASYLSKREFLVAFYAATLDRMPTVDELSALGPDVDAPVTLADRQQVTARLRADLKDAFVGDGSSSSGLLKLARAIGGAPGISANQELTTAQASALQLEFYEAFKNGYDARSYPSYFKDNTVWINAVTAPLYENTIEEMGNAGTPCAAPSGAEWKQCAMTAPRSGFFTTRGFLTAKRSSFLDSNNNYGRVAQMYSSLFGEGVRPATGGPTGGNAALLPDCLEADDTRRINADPAPPAPVGTAAVASQGAICQTCHVSRSMASGSVLFRVFSRNGSVYDTTSFGSVDKASFDVATKDSAWKVGPIGCQNAADQCGTPQTSAQMTTFLTHLLSNSLDKATRKACVATGDPTAPYKVVADVGEFAGYYVGRSAAAIARGFARHANRAFANSSGVTLELANDVASAWHGGAATLPDLVDAYFLSETFACNAQPSQGGTP